MTEEDEDEDEEEEKEEEEEETGDTEGTCYALRDMAEARGIHNFVKTKMLRSCLGGVAFFLVSRNVQARFSLRPSSLGSCLLPFSQPLVPSATSVVHGARISFFSPVTFLSFILPVSLLVRVVPPRASSLSRFSGNAPRNEKRFVKNVSASS